MMSLGVIAKYIENTLIEARARPRYLVDWFK